MNLINTLYMRWFYCKKEELIGAECINGKTDKHILRLSPNPYNSGEDEVKADTRFLVEYINNIPTVKDIKKKLLSLQSEYDNSDEVNSFYLNGKTVWLNKATRVGLVNLLNFEKSINKTDTTLWLNSFSITINIDKALQLLAAVELYAKECYNNTHQHLSDINKLKTIEECLSFDITAGYPKKLNIEIEQ